MWGVELETPDDDVRSPTDSLEYSAPQLPSSHETEDDFRRTLLAFANLPTRRYANYRLLVEVLMQARFLQGTRQETSVGSEARAKAESFTGGHLGRNSQLLKPWLRSGPRARS